jgi:ribose transport system permease protein
MTAQRAHDPSRAETREAAVDDPRSVAPRSVLRRMLSSTPFYILVVDVVLVIFFGLKSQNHVFIGVQNFQAVTGDAAEALLLAVGVTYLLGAGVFDLSLGANLILASVLGGLTLTHLVAAKATHASAAQILLTLLVCLLSGLGVGAVNGILIAYLSINSLIVTLGTLGICTGTAYVLSHGSDIAGLPMNLQTSIGLRYVLGVPLPALVALFILIVAWAVLRFTRYGTRTLAIGSSLTAADRAGLRVRRHLLSLTLLAGALAGLAGFIDLARFGTTNTSGHTLDALAALTAAVVGGTRLTGGRATLVGTLWGTVLAYVLLDGLTVIGLPSFYQQIATGVILILAVAIDTLRSRRRL